MRTRLFAAEQQITRCMCLWTRDRRLQRRVWCVSHLVTMCRVCSVQKYFVSLTHVCVTKQRSENVRRLSKYLSEHGARDLASKSKDILKLHRGKEKILFKKLVHQFGGVLKYYSGVKKRRMKKSETKSNKSRKSNAIKLKSNSSNKEKANSSKTKAKASKTKVKASTAAVVPHTNRRATNWNVA